MINRKSAGYILKVAASYPVVTIMGPRQSGKTTLAKALFPRYEYCNLFENMVVMEALKSRLNKGEEPDMWFYRNATGTVEVDLLLEHGGCLSPYEIKASSTYSDKMSRHLAEFAEMVPNARKGLVVYSGKTYDDVAINFRDAGEWMKI